MNRKATLLLVGIGLSFSGLVASSYAATRLEFHGTMVIFDPDHEDVKRETSELQLVGDGIVVSDRGIITDINKGTITFIDHDQKTYHVAKLPLLLEDYANHDQKKHLKKFSAFLAATHVEITQGSEMVKQGSWNARHMYANITTPDNSMRYEFDVWLSTDFDIDWEARDTDSRSRLALGLASRVWADQLVDLEGMAVHQRVTMHSGGGRRVVREQKLVSVEENVEIPVSETRPPSNYKEVPFDVSRYIRFPPSVGATGLRQGRTGSSR